MSTSYNGYLVNNNNNLLNVQVDHEGGAPVYYKRDVVFTNLVVDKVVSGRKT